MSEANTVELELARREGLKWHIVYFSSYYKRIKYRATFCGTATYATEIKTVNKSDINDINDIDGLCKTCKRVLMAEGSK